MRGRPPPFLAAHSLLTSACGMRYTRCRYPNPKRESKAAGFMKEKGPRALVIKRVDEEARDIRAFDVLREGARDCHDISFTPGQVALLEVGGAGRCYFAIASAPDDDELEFLVKLSNDDAGRAIYE